STMSVITLAEDVSDGAEVEVEEDLVKVNPEAFTDNGELSEKGDWFTATDEDDNGKITVEVDPIHVTE
ncbi:MAG: hypothetical protein V5A81_05805, partial [Candidatus Bipolaricaulota bacterium]